MKIKIKPCSITLASAFLLLLLILISSTASASPLQSASSKGPYAYIANYTNVTAIESKSTTVYAAEELPWCVASFESFTDEKNPLSVQFTDNSYCSAGDMVMFWEWDFGDGTTSNEQNPLHIYPSSGSYEVKLTATGEWCQGKTSRMISVQGRVLVANFSTNTTEGVAPLLVQFTDLSENATELYWSFGDGEYSTERNPTHTFYYNEISPMYSPYSPVYYLVTLTALSESGADSKSESITVYPAAELPWCIASFESFTDEKNPLSVQFIDNSDCSAGDMVMFWEWDFGDGTTSNEQNPLHIYPSPGSYEVTLTATGEWCQGKTSRIINVQDFKVPVANFSTNTTEGVAPLSVQFTDTSENVNGWNWDFGDGWNSTEQNPEHTYLTPGTYTVNLTAINGYGTDSTLATINVSEKPVPILPVANFSTNVSEGFVPLSVQFNDSSKNATSINWNFGDGNSSTERNPVHEFATRGNYTVNLTAVNENGTNSTFATITVLEKPVPIIWEFSPREPVCGDTLIINGSASPEEKVNVSVTFEKNVSVSDGKFEYILENVTIPEGLNNIFTVEAKKVNNLNVRVKMILWVTKSSEASGDIATVSQSNVPAGTYTIKIDGNTEESISEVNLKVTASQSIQANSKGNFSYSYNTTMVPAGKFEVKVGDITKEITIKPQEIEKPSSVFPISNFSTNVTEGYAPLTVQFNDGSKNATSINWDFGDGWNSTERNPKHTYLTPGTYTVNLTAINRYGTDSTSATINVSEKPLDVPPVANFTANLTVKFTDTSTNSPTAWKWNFGDGDTSIEQSPEHIFNREGTYNITLVAINAGGSSEVRSMVITFNHVLTPPVANFTVKQTGPLTVQFNDLSLNEILERTWTFGDGFTSTDTNPTHSYATAGTYTVNLTVSNSDGTDTASKTITITGSGLDSPKPSFTAVPWIGRAPLTVNFTDKSTNADSIVWDFGDKSAISTESKPSHIYTTAGVYHVKLTATNGGESNVATKKIYVLTQRN